jgi:hypothetical protein
LFREFFLKGKRGALPFVIALELSGDGVCRWPQWG